MASLSLLVGSLSGNISRIPGRSAMPEAAASLSVCEYRRNNWLIQLASLHSYIRCNPGLIIAWGSQPQGGWPWILFRIVPEYISVQSHWSLLTDLLSIVQPERQSCLPSRHIDWQHKEVFNRFTGTASYVFNSCLLILWIELSSSRD